MSKGERWCVCARVITSKYRTNAVNIYLTLSLLLSPATLTAKLGVRQKHTFKAHMSFLYNKRWNISLCFIFRRWHVVGKSECSAKCGSGYRSLDVRCMKYSLTKRQSERVEASACGNSIKPRTRESCHGDCLLKSWQYSAWSQVQLMQNTCLFLLYLFFNILLFYCKIKWRNIACFSPYFPIILSFVTLKTERESLSYQ